MGYTKKPKETTNTRLSYFFYNTLEKKYLEALVENIFDKP